MNAVGLAACEAAYLYGDEWLEAVRQYIQENIQFTKNYLKQNITQIKMIEPEATYLVWLDCRGLGLCNRDLKDLIINRAGLWLDSGAIFGKAGSGFQRINVACPRATLETALGKLAEAVKSLA